MSLHVALLFLLGQKHLLQVDMPETTSKRQPLRRSLSAGRYPEQPDQQPCQCIHCVTPNHEKKQMTINTMPITRTKSFHGNYTDHHSNYSDSKANFEGNQIPVEGSRHGSPVVSRRGGHESARSRQCNQSPASIRRQPGGGRLQRHHSMDRHTSLKSYFLTNL